MKNDVVLHMRLPSAVRERLVEKASESGGYAAVLRDLIGAYVDGRITVKRNVHIEIQEKEPTT